MSETPEKCPNTEDMFGETVDASIEQVLAHIDQLSADDLKHIWPARLVEFFELTAHTITKVQGLDEKQVHQLSAALVTAIANHFGGMSFYLPHNEKLEKAVRDIKIWHEFKGNNIDRLAKKYRVSEMTIRTAVANQLALRRAKLQPQLDLQ